MAQERFERAAEAFTKAIEKDPLLALPTTNWGKPT